MAWIRKAGTGARFALAAIRFVNGSLALVAPRVLAKTSGVDPDANPAALYALRLFGVRTVYTAWELALARGDHARDALAVAPALHASDALSAFTAGRNGQLPPGPAKRGTAISSVNFVLAILAALTARPARRRLPGRR
jgi:hypothetical protein